MDFKAVSLTKDTIKTVNDPNIEDNEEYLNIRETTNQEKINKKLNWSDKANNIPRYVATPFPPFNPSQIGKRCPKNANRDDKWINSGKFWETIITGKYPFAISKKRVAKAKNLLPVLRTLVAPIFPDPIFLISTLLKIFVNISPKGIEPLKYESKITKIISIINYMFS